MLLFKFSSYRVHRLGHDLQPVLLGDILVAPDQSQILEVFTAFDPAAAQSRSLHLTAHLPEAAYVLGLDLLVVHHAFPSGHQPRLTFMSASGAALRDSDTVAVGYKFSLPLHISYTLMRRIRLGKILLAFHNASCRGHFP